MARTIPPAESNRQEPPDNVSSMASFAARMAMKSGNPVNMTSEVEVHEDRAADSFEPRQLSSLPSGSLSSLQYDRNSPELTSFAARAAMKSDSLEGTPSEATIHEAVPTLSNLKASGPVPQFCSMKSAIQKTQTQELKTMPHLLPHLNICGLIRATEAITMG